jgi:hypothetical protein
MVDLRMKLAAPVAIERESPLDVAMAEKSKRHGETEKRFEGVGDTDQVLIFIEGRAMCKLHIRETVDGKRAVGESAQPFEVLRRQGIVCPSRCHCSDRIKPLDAGNTGAGAVMVPPDVNLADLPYPLYDLIRAGAVADYVTQVYSYVVGRRRLKASLKCFKIPMDIAD